MKSNKLPNLLQMTNISIGFLGIQLGFALQAGNVSRILQTFGAHLEHLSLFWLVAPLTGMIIQPIVGYYSDRTWTSLGRRKPYLLLGGCIAALALLFLPNANLFTHLIPPLLLGVFLMIVVDTAFNTSMHPLRALVSDLVPPEQQGLGYAMQTFLIGVGAIIGSILPYILVEYFHVNKITTTGAIPDNVSWSFYIGARILLLCLLWTLFTVKEKPKPLSHTYTEQSAKGFQQIIQDIRQMPFPMIKIGIVQFFSWFALFTMWVYTTPALAQHIYKLPVLDASSEAYADAGNLTGLLFGIYSFVATVIALALPYVYNRLGQVYTHALSLFLGALGFISIFFIENSSLLLIPMIAIGIAWASILATPYALLAQIL